MPIYLDGESVDIQGKDLATVLEAAQRKLAPSGRVLVEVLLNGQSLVGDEIDAHGGDPVTGAELKLESANPRDLAVSTLEQVRGGLDAARQAQFQAAELFKQDQSAQAMHEVSRAIEVWQQTQQAVLHSTILMGINLDTKMFEDKPISALADELLDHLKRLRELITANDTVGLADSLAYEWPEVTDRWERLISELIKWIEQR